MKQKVESREYKVMLKKECFTGPEAQLLKQAEKFWGNFRSSIQDIVIDTDGRLDTIGRKRTIRFYDTADHRLQQCDYVFRERIDVETDEREVTLKFRHPDRYIAQDRNMDAANVEVQDQKFEEDIKPPFLKLYSFSSKQRISGSKSLNKMNDPGELYPGLQKGLDFYEDDEPIFVVGTGLDEDGCFTAKELVIEGGDKEADFQIREDPKVEAECALVVWYEVGGNDEKPVVVEFSFKYKNKQEEYDGEAAKRAYDVFEGLGDKLSQWVAPKGTTKTAFAYSRAKSE